MIDKSKIYKTRDGREVRIYATDGGIGDTVHGAILNEHMWLVGAWDANGVYVLPYRIGDTIMALDLIEVRPRIKRTVWLNVYDDGDVMGWRSKEEAAAISAPGRVACVRVEIDCEEGEGL